MLSNPIAKLITIAMLHSFTKTLPSDSATHLTTIRLVSAPSPEPGSEDFCRVRFAECEFCCAVNKCLPEDECNEIEISNLFLSYGVVFTQVLIVVVGLIAIVLRAGKFRKYNVLLGQRRRSNAESVDGS